MLNKAAIQKMISGTREERVYLAKKSFPLFFAYYFLEYIKYPFAPFHFTGMNNMQKLIEDYSHEMLFIAYRESAKTAIARGFITWLTVCEISPYILVGSQTQDNAEANLFAVITEIQSNQRLISDFGNQNPVETTEEKGFNRIKKFLTSRGVLLETITTSQRPRGRNHIKQRPTFALLDDIETLSSSMSEAETAKTKRFLSELLPAMDSKDGKILYLANHFSDMGVVQDLVNNNQHMIYMNVPIYDAQMNLSWPAKYCFTDDESKKTDKVSIEHVKRMARDSVTFEQEYLNMPMNEERRVFKKTMFKYKTWDQIKDKRLSCYILIDPAMTDEENGKVNDNDYTGISIVWIDVEGFWYVKSYRKRFGPKELVDQMFALQQTYKPEKMGIEKIGFTKGLKPYWDSEQRRRNEFFVLYELEHGGINKQIRIKGLLPYYESSTIFHLEGECDDLENEMVRFPLGDHDDAMDSLAYAPKLVERPYNDGSEEGYEHLFEDVAIQYPEIGY